MKVGHFDLDLTCHELSVLRASRRLPGDYFLINREIKLRFAARVRDGLPHLRAADYSIALNPK
jgi:hypothetical protein